jgi:hypothetical protein
VVGGGDTTPEGLADAPRRFVYRVETGDGSIARVAYTAYPPSPADDGVGIILRFHAGVVRVGDFLVARGHYDEAGILVVSEGGSIETFAERP